MSNDALVAIIVTLTLAAIGGGFTAWNSLRNEIRDSRHKVVADLMARFLELDDDVDRLKERVTRLEARQGGG